MDIWPQRQLRGAGVAGAVLVVAFRRWAVRDIERARVAHNTTVP